MSEDKKDVLDMLDIMKHLFGLKNTSNLKQINIAHKEHLAEFTLVFNNATNGQRGTRVYRETIGLATDYEFDPEQFIKQISNANSRAFKALG